MVHLTPVRSGGLHPPTLSSNLQAATTRPIGTSRVGLALLPTNLADVIGRTPRRIRSESDCAEARCECKAATVREREAAAALPECGCPLSIARGEGLDDQPVTREKRSGEGPVAADGADLLSNLRPIHGAAAHVACERFFYDIGPGFRIEVGE